MDENASYAGLRVRDPLPQAQNVQQHPPSQYSMRMFQGNIQQKGEVTAWGVGFRSEEA